MEIFAITFRIEHDASYSERYSSVVDAIKQACHGDCYWDEPTSFFLLENPTTSSDIAAWISRNSTFSERKDLLLVINLSKKGYTAIGVVNDACLHKLMKKR